MVGRVQEEDAELAVSSGQLLGGAASRLLRALAGAGMPPKALHQAAQRALNATQALSSLDPGKVVGAELRVVVELLEKRRGEAVEQAAHASALESEDAAARELAAITLELEAAQRCVCVCVCGWYIAL